MYYYGHRNIFDKGEDYMTKKILAVALIVVLMLGVCSCGGKGEKAEEDVKTETKVLDITGVWSRNAEDGTELVYVIKPLGEGYIEAYNLTFDLKWEVDNGNYSFNIDATPAYEKMFGMTIDEIIAANLIDEASLHTTESGKCAISGGYLMLMHDGVTDYLHQEND